jgi:pyruvate/2-oxoglutarate/acetoin dehydrogenase E1 component
VTQGMLAEFGPERVRNTPISEMALAGTAIGAAMQGMRPVAEIMYEQNQPFNRFKCLTSTPKTSQLQPAAH